MKEWRSAKVFRARWEESSLLGANCHGKRERKWTGYRDRPCSSNPDNRRREGWMQLMEWIEDSGCSRVGCAPKRSGLWFRLYLYAEQFRHFYLVTVPEFYLILILPCFPSKSSLYVLTAGWYLKEMYLPSMLVNGDGDTVSKFRVSRRKLRKQLIYPALALGKSLY